MRGVENANAHSTQFAMVEWHKLQTYAHTDEYRSLRANVLTCKRSVNDIDENTTNGCGMYA